MIHTIFFRLFTLASIWFLLFSLKMPPDFEQKFKNPCFYDACHQTNNGTKRKLRCLPFFHVLGVENVVQQIYIIAYCAILRSPQIMESFIRKPRGGRGGGMVSNCWPRSPALQYQTIKILSTKVEGVDKYQYITFLFDSLEIFASSE